MLTWCLYQSYLSNLNRTVIYLLIYIILQVKKTVFTGSVIDIDNLQLQVEIQIRLWWDGLEFIWTERHSIHNKNKHLLATLLGTPVQFDEMQYRLEQVYFLSFCNITIGFTDILIRSWWVVESYWSAQYGEVSDYWFTVDISWMRGQILRNTDSYNALSLLTADDKIGNHTSYIILVCRLLLQ